jgi:hypothetical protein
MSRFLIRFFSRNWSMDSQIAYPAISADSGRW